MPSKTKREPKPSVTVKDVPADKFISAYAAHLKKSGKMDLPKWVDMVKTGTFKELAPYNPDWFYIRAASMARRVYLRPGTGVGAFRKVYGGPSQSGTRRSHFKKASGGVARNALHALAKLKVLEVDPKGGRRITSTGQRDLDRIAGAVARQTPNATLV